MSAILLLLKGSQLKAIAILRILRAIKPLRTLTKSAGMRLVFKSLTLSLAAMGNLSVICLLFIFVFAILGVQLFAGKFYSCNDGGVPNRGACTGAPRCTCRIAELLSALPPAPSSPRSAACATGC